MSHSNISIFVPHLGCQNQCSFCNQNHITGFKTLPAKDDVDNAVKIAASSKKYDNTDCEIAFFGGSFTAIDKDYMTELLSAASPYVEKGIVSGIRISTRPDCIDSKTLALLKEYNVTAIELGAQSMCDDVLLANKRGHTSKDVVEASYIIKQFGFELGLQMMTGLYKSDFHKDTYTAEQIIGLAPKTVRIYPTIILKNTPIGELYLNGQYTTYSLNDTVKLCSKLVLLFEEQNINVIRLGLHSIETDAYLSGPWHPAFSELCRAEIFKNQINSQIQNKGNYEVCINSADASKVAGHKRSNIIYFVNKGINLKIIKDDSIEKNKLLIREVK